MKIGFYNPRIETCSTLSECKIIFTDFNELKKHVKQGDTVAFASSYSCIDVDYYEWAEIEKKYNLTPVVMPRILDRA